MIATCVACGDSAVNWISRGITIGVNDVGRFGKPVDILILVNRPAKFKSDRLRTISQHKGAVLTNSVNEWRGIFPQAKKLERMVSFSHRVNKSTHYTSATSPMIAISHAIALGANHIILWGVDFKNHKSYAQGSKRGNREIDVYRKFFKAVERLGVRVYLGALGTAFDNDLPLYPQGDTL